MYRRLFLWFLSFFVVSSYQPVQASDFSIVEDGVDFTITTSQDVYKKGEEISFTLRIKNTNSFPITNIEISELLPPVLRLKEEFSEISIDRLEPGAIYQFEKPILAEVIPKETKPPSSEVEVIQPGIINKPEINPEPNPPYKPEAQPNSNPTSNALQQPILTPERQVSATPTSTLENSISGVRTKSESMKVANPETPTDEGNTSAIIANKTKQSETTESTEKSGNVETTQEVAPPKETNQARSVSANFAISFGALAIVGLVGYLLYDRKTRKHFLVILTLSGPFSSFLIPKQVGAVEEESRQRVEIKKVIVVDEIEYELGFALSYDSFSPEGYVEDSNIVISVNQSPNDEVVKVETDIASLSGRVESGQPIKFLYATYYSNVDQRIRQLPVSGTSMWLLENLPVDIGTNFITLHAFSENGGYQSKPVLINRLSTVLKLADNVHVLDPATSEGMEAIRIFNETYLGQWVDDLGNEDPSDDLVHLLVDNKNPLLTQILNDELVSGDILYIPENELFLNGFSFHFVEHDDTPNEWGFDSDSTEVLKGYEANFFDMIEGEISLMTDSLDPQDPVDYIIAPEGASVRIGETSFTMPEQRNDDELRSMMRMRQIPEASLDGEDPLVSYDVGDMNLTVNNDFDVEIGLDNYEIINEDNASLNASVKFTITDINPTFGFERNSLLGLPEQMLAKMTYSEGSKVNPVLEFDATGEEFENFMETANKNHSVTNGRSKSLYGLKLSGIDLSRSVVVGAIGLNAATGMVTLQSDVFSQPLSVNYVILLILDAEGRLNAKLSIDLNRNAYIEKGINFQKENFIGSYGSTEDNAGTNNDKKFGYWVQTYDVSADSKFEKMKKASTSGTLQLAGGAGFTSNLSAGLGVTLLGTMPIAIRTGVGPVINAEGEVNLNWNGEDFVPSLTGKVEFRLALQAMLRADVAMKLQKVNIKNDEAEVEDLAGFNYSLGPVKWNLLDREWTQDWGKGSVQGTIYATDFDQDTSNDRILSDANVLLQPHIAGSGSYETRTDDAGRFFIEDIEPGKYKIILNQQEYEQVVIEEYLIEDDLIEQVFYMDPQANLVTLSGLVTIADTDKDAGNDIPLEGVNVRLRKKFSSTERMYEQITNSEGNYLFDGMSVGVYEIILAKEGYLGSQGIVILGANGAIFETNYKMEAIPASYAGIGSVKGIIVDSSTGLPAEGEFELIFRPGYNNPNAEVMGYATAVNGMYEIDLPAGNYTVFINPNPQNSIQFQSDTFFVKSLGNEVIGEQNGTVTSPLGSDQIRIVLTWGEQPRDLDSHLFAELTDNSEFLIYFGNKKKIVDEKTSYILDVDDTSSYGPETTTITNPQDGVYTFKVHNYSRDVDLRNSNAMVKVYFGKQTMPRIFYVPDWVEESWDVFKYDAKTDTFTILEKTYLPINTMVAPLQENYMMLMSEEEALKPKEEMESIVE